jgi:predicted nucleic acid-binding protein
VYLADEEGHEQAAALLADSQTATVTGTWTRIDVSAAALIRAARSGRADVGGLLALLDADLGIDGPVAVLSAPQDDVEERALALVREHALRAMDAWHLATAVLNVPGLAEPGEPIAFASRDEEQAAVAELLGFVRI